jgi:hypothetical protein
MNGDCLTRALVEMRDRWLIRRDELAKLHASVPGPVLCDVAIQDLTALIDTMGNELLTLTEAAHRSGYTREHLGRLVVSGEIPNAGRRNAPRIRVLDLPRKPGHLPGQRVDSQIPGTSKRQIVRSIVNPKGDSR